ncbi:hypothetical protein [Arthrobacter sp. Y-9]|uniref:hypothetical protein n=1 Tax=Arthrobacter sp. Y-9 TaxID=3039385 RepID=UPI00241C0BF8|nr:hypothetical protein [Arthrobacter sp. Y-9]WFR84511.1 hypothetical protein P9849_02370 [Arthrobacter sp. Y-9]
MTTEHPREPLALNGVLASALPPELGTYRAPSRYTVAAVFTRRPEARELFLLGAPETRRTLDEAGYTAVELQVADRRLFITNTSLEELKQGLAVVIADLLAQISSEVQEEWALQTERLSVLADEEGRRLRDVEAAAAEISFVSSAWSRL